MILKSYLFSFDNNNYEQYTTDDYTESLFKQFCKDCMKSSVSNQIAIHRSGNLMYYVYTQKKYDSVVYGICIVCGEICTNLKWLYKYFQKFLEISAHKGVLFCYDKNGTIQKKVNNFSDETAEIDNFFYEIKEHISNGTAYWEDLSPENYTIPLSSKITLAFSEDNTEKITKAIRLYHNVVVTMENINPSSYAQTVKRLNSENRQLSEQSQTLEKEINTLSKQKKQYKTVIFLSIAIMICAIAILSFNNNVNTLKYIISKKEDTIKCLNDTIANANNKIKEANNIITEANNKIKQLEQNVIDLDYSSRLKDNIISKNEETIFKNNQKMDSLQSLYNNKVKQYNEVKKYKEIINDINNHYKAPIIITDIKIGNTDYDNSISPKYGEKINSYNTMYLQPQISYIGLKSGTKKLKVKWYNPNGSLRTGESSPPGFTQSGDYYFVEGYVTKELRGWGSEKKGHWSAGTYRIEIWYENICLKSKTFEIY